MFEFVKMVKKPFHALQTGQFKSNLVLTTVVKTHLCAKGSTTSIGQLHAKLKMAKTKWLNCVTARDPVRLIATMIDLVILAGEPRNIV